MKYILAFIAVAAVAASAQSALITRSYDLNGTDFTGTDVNGAFIWGMDLNPINNVGQVDVDNNSTKDFHESAATNVDPSDGLASNTDGTLFRWDYGGSPSRAVGLETGNNSYTFEVALDIKSTGTEGTRGVFGIALEFTGSADQGRIQWEIERTGMSFFGGGAASTVLSPSALSQSNVGAHTYRVTYDAANTEFWLYRDLELLNLNGVGVSGVDATANVGNPSSTLIGDYSGGLGGDWEVDYIALDSTGAFAVVPEPSSLALLGVALAMLGHWRKRK